MMDTLGAREERLHQRVAELLPWYVNGTLETAEQQAVLGHLAGCARCRAELDAARDLARAVKSAEAVAPSPHPVQLARLLARIDAAGPAGEEEPEMALLPVQGDAARRRTGLLAFSPRRMRQLLVAELAAILVLAVSLAWQRRPPMPPTSPTSPARYTTLSEETPIVAAPGRLPIRVLFAKNATAGRIQQILAGISGTITSGPSPAGAYVVEVKADADPVDVVVAYLRAQPEVSFAAPVAGGG
ncbi:MAG TPA: zf-HC2 domain-containing protein [Thermoanaerobaculia bacterium]|nr:zf-HC2 domain-containing protein [Thermoanaerobaculia bacterium]